MKKKLTKKEQQRHNMLVKKYGITLKQYKAMYKKQGGKCKICNKRKKLVVDHAHHLKGKASVRNLLCSKCNLALGLVNESIDIVKNMLKYLLHHIL